MADRSLDVRLRVRNARAFNADTKKAERGIKQLGSSTGRSALRAKAGAKAMGGFTTALKAVGRGALYAGGALAAGGVVLGKRSIDEWREAQKVTADTANSIRVTGHAAHVSARQVSDLSTAISNKTGIDDEAIQKGSNLLLTFTKIRNEAGKGNKFFDRATKAAVDMSAKGFGSIESSSKMLGKALNDPIKGITAMSRAGVSFTEKEKEKIAALVESGHLLEAQEKIMTSVEKQGIKGTAAAIADPIDKLKTSWANLEESIGGVIGPPAMMLVDKFSRAVQGLQPEINNLAAGMSEIWDPKENRSFGENLALSRRLIRTQLGPVWEDVKDDLDDADVGGKLAAVVGDAIPVMAEAAGKGGGAVVKAFVKGWWDADLGAKLFTLGLLSAKFGVFTTLGGMAAGKFKQRFATKAASGIATSVAADGAVGSAVLGGTTAAGGGAWAKYGRWAGRAFGVAAAVFIAKQVQDELEDKLGIDITGFTPTDPAGNTPLQGLLDHGGNTGDVWRENDRRWRRRHGSGGGANTIGRKRNLPGAGLPGIQGVGARASLKRFSGDGLVQVNNVVRLDLDGKTVAEVVGRHVADAKARR